MRVLGKVIRGGRVESIHRIEAIVVNRDQEFLFETEQPEYQTYIRSSAKPFQVYPLVESGAADAYDLTPAELALCCASHNGEEIHVNTVRNIHKRTGVHREQLLCGIHNPMDTETAESLLKSNETITEYHNNCSGKHTGMLLACKHQGFPTDDYIDPAHPLQRQIREYLESIIGRQGVEVGIDGCSVPTFYMSLKELAIGFQRLAGEVDPYLDTIYYAMTSEPYMVAGKNRFDTDFMQAVNGSVVSKVGAEGVRGLGIRRNGDTYGLALKVLDGSKRVSAAAALHIMEMLGWFNPADYPDLESYYAPEITNHRGVHVGRVAIEII
ncbi:MAG: hypothetical protein MAGBODY4_00075 [Candidatus Marinimicrobia bacterium]|nr:hypothetical protein [Candidatus Neomarinimicrobiota bacterium]